MAKITSLAELTDVASDDLLVVVDKSDTSMADSGTDKKVQKVNLLKGLVPEDGWILAGEAWTYASATTFTISGDKRGKYQKGDKIKLTQTSVKYFYIIGVSYTSPNTTITVTGGSDYSLANATITNPYYSKVENPQGFPGMFNFTTTFTNYSDVTTKFAKFNIKNNLCTTIFHFIGTVGSVDTIFFNAPVAINAGAYNIFSTGSFTSVTGVFVGNASSTSIYSGPLAGGNFVSGTGKEWRAAYIYPI